MKRIMCGIVGYAGNGEALPILLDGLSKIYEQPKAIRSTVEPYMMCGVDGILKDVFPVTSSVKRIKMVACRN